MGESVADRWREAVRDLRAKTWKRAGQRAVHKPLLTLLVIERAARGAPREVAFTELEDRLRQLLASFGPPRRSYHPEFPFWHLRTSPYWEIVEGLDLQAKKQGSSPPVRSMRASCVGAVPQPLWDALVHDPALRHELALQVVTDFWPPTYHENVLQAVGLPGADGPPTARKRSPVFRDLVLRAYEQRCAVCGYDGRLVASTFALEAAHIRWFCEGGPDEVTNGVALCSFHHTALDYGAWGIDEERRILVSQDVVGGDAVEALLLQYSGRTLRLPQAANQVPTPSFIEWHWHKVFKKPARAF